MTGIETTELCGRKQFYNSKYCCHIERKSNLCDVQVLNPHLSYYSLFSEISICLICDRPEYAYFCGGRIARFLPTLFQENTGFEKLSESRVCTNYSIFISVPFLGQKIALKFSEFKKKTPHYA